MAEKKYINGYEAKVDYYLGKVEDAVNELDSTLVSHYAEKLSYFVGKQHIWKKEIKVVEN